MTAKEEEKDNIKELLSKAQQEMVFLKGQNVILERQLQKNTSGESSAKPDDLLKVMFEFDEAYRRYNKVLEVLTQILGGAGLSKLNSDAINEAMKVFARLGAGDLDTETSTNKKQMSKLDIMKYVGDKPLDVFTGAFGQKLGDVIPGGAGKDDGAVGKAVQTIAVSAAAEPLARLSPFFILGVCLVGVVTQHLGGFGAALSAILERGEEATDNPVSQDEPETSSEPPPGVYSCFQVRSAM
ncbi:hypothetical protein K440DRAFT_206165 [Wilcoxina mikolae CBS 423.85]|nr:hypothetical protein K440DRAFT_206165 [Wilcoxina mikolae CBS 423.85]